MKKALLIAVAVPALLLAGCGTTSNNTSNANPSTTPTNSTTGAQATKSSLKTQDITLTILPGEHYAAADGKLHDTYSPADFKVVQGVPVKVSVYNYDSGEHSFTSTGLGVNQIIKGSTKNGVPAVTTFTFTPTKAGKIDWHCAMKCDGGMTSYSMTHDGYMKGVVDVVPSNNQQYIDLTIKDGLKYAAADGKLHDAYSPTDFTVQKGIPVTVSVTNYDMGQHTMTSSALGLNQLMAASTKEGVPAVTTFTFTPTKDGDFTWHCAMKCDGGMTSYAMTHQGYMEGTIHVVG